MSEQREKKILKEIQQRVFEEDEKLKQRAEIQDLKEATFEVLSENTTLSKADIEKISQEVRAEYLKKRKMIYIMLAVFSIIGVTLISLVFMLNRINETELFIPPKSSPQPIVEPKAEIPQPTVPTLPQLPVTTQVPSTPKPVPVKVTSPALPAKQRAKMDGSELATIINSVRPLNQLIDILNNNIIASNKSVNCLKRYYQATIKAKQKTGRLYGEFNCSYAELTNEPEKALLELDHSGVDSTPFKSDVAQYILNTKELDAKLQELLIYQRQKAYQTDHFDRSELLLTEIIDRYSSIQDVVSIIQKSAQNTYQTLTQKIAPDFKEKFRLSHILTAGIEEDQALLKLWKYNLAENVWTNAFPYDAIFDNLRKHYAVEDNSQLIKAQFKYPLSHFYTLTLGNLKTRLKNKGWMEDQRSFMRWDNDEYSNEAYEKLDPQYLISDYNYFVEQCMKSNIPLLKKLLYVRQITINTKQGDYPFYAHTPDTPIDTSIVSPTPNQHPLDADTFDLLKRTIDFLDDNIYRSQNEIHRSIKKFEDALARSRKNQTSKYHVSFYGSSVFPVSHVTCEQLSLAFKSNRQVDPATVKTVIKQLNTLVKLSDEIYFQTIQLHLHSHKGNSAQWNEKQLTQHVGSLKKLLNKSNNQQTYLIKNIDGEYDAFAHNYENPLMKASLTFLETLDMIHKVAIKGNSILDEEDDLNTFISDLKAIHKNHTENEFSLLAGVPQGRGFSYDNPYRLYDKFTGQIEKTIQALTKKQRGFNLIYKYNELVSTYNLFAKKASNYRDQTLKCLILPRTKLLVEL